MFNGSDLKYVFCGQLSYSDGVLGTPYIFCLIAITEDKRGHGLLLSQGMGNRVYKPLIYSSQ